MVADESGLTPVEASVLAERFPQHSERPLTFQEIGHALGLCKERIRQIQETALGKLRAALEADPVLQPRR